MLDISGLDGYNESFTTGLCFSFVL